MDANPKQPQKQVTTSNSPAYANATIPPVETLDPPPTLPAGTMNNGGGNIQASDGATTSPTPGNSKPRTDDPTDLDETYVYRDFSTVPPPPVGSSAGIAALAAPHPQSLQAQKLPAKLASMLSDTDLASVITWLPHGRSWRVLNRDLFAEHGLPRYFGHKNYASFVRIVNAWGFRRITRGPDRDSYYHELFLRGRPDLNQRMKRLSNCHRKTPVHKEDKFPDFYELAKTNPLPDVPLTRGGGQVGGGVGAPAVPSMVGSAAMMNPALAALGGGAGFSQGLHGFGQNALGGAAGGNNLMSQLLANQAAGSFQAQASPDVSRLTQLQRDNEELRRRIFDLERKKGPAGSQAQGGGIPGNIQVAAALSSQAVSTNPGGNPAAIGNDMINRELDRMQSMYANGVNMNNTLLSSLGGGTGGAPTVPGGMAGMPGTNAREFSFMPSFPRGDMLLQSMRGDNQMGYRPQGSQGGGSGSNSSTTSSLERALQQHATPPVPGGVAMTADDRNKLVMDFLAKQQKQQGGAL